MKKRLHDLKSLPMLYRDASITRVEPEDGDSSEEKRYEIAISSETEVRRSFFGVSWREVLGHKKDEVVRARLERGMPFLADHDTRRRIGRVLNGRLDKDGIVRGQILWSDNDLAQERKRDVDKGIADGISVGYAVHRWKLIEEDDEKGDLYRATLWEPHEASDVAVPADISVGYGRTRSGGGEEWEFEVEEDETAGDPGKEERAMSVPVGTPPPAGGTQAAAPTAVRVERNLADEAAEIMEMSIRNGLTERAAGWIREGLTPDQVARQILDARRTAGPGQPGAESVQGPVRDKARYSITRAVQMALAYRERGDAALVGAEGEMHRELERSLPNVVTRNGGILVPYRRFSMEERLELAGQRALGSNEPSGGATLVNAQVMPEMIEILQNRTVVIESGAEVFTGLTAPLAWNKETGQPEVYWADENPATGVTESEPAFGQVHSIPKSLMGATTIPRQLLTLATIDVDAHVQNRLGGAAGRAVDRGGLHGTGTDKQPLGVFNAPDILTHSVGGVPDWDDVVTIPAKLSDQNADLGALAHITTPLLAGKMKATPIVDGFPTFLWDGTYREGMLGGYKARASNQVSKVLGVGSDEHGWVYGNWNDMVVGFWGPALEVIVDPYTQAKKGQVVISVFMMADTTIKRAQSFCYGTGAKLA